MRQDNLAAPEVKSGGSGDVAEAFDDFMHAFDEFKQANDERLAQIESKVGDILDKCQMKAVAGAWKMNPSIIGFAMIVRLIYAEKASLG